MSSYYEKITATGAVKCIDEEIPFDIPQGWEWERWGNISQSIQYGYNAPALEHGAIKMVRISDIQENCVLWDNVPYCKIEENDIDTYLLKVNDILFARTGGTVGKSFLVEEVPERAIYAGYLIRTRYSSLLNPRYMKLFMESQLYWEQLKNGTIATAQPNCNGKTLAKMLLPIPPTKEQDRIVGKLTQLSSFLNNYTLYQERLNLLNEEIKEQLKKSILQEAIQGKLVPQIAEEGTAQELLEQIKAEKQKLVKEGKLKKSALNDSVIFRGDDNKYYTSKNKDTICIDDEIPFEIPDSWVWVRFGTIMINRDRERIPLSVAQRQFLSKRYDYYGASGVIDKVDRYLFDKELLLIGEDGANLLNRSTPIAFIAKGKYWVNNHAHVLDVYDGVLLKYIALYINSISLVPYVTGTAQPKMNQEKMNSILIALPPQKEQQRIVAQIEKLFEQLH